MTSGSSGRMASRGRSIRVQVVPYSGDEPLQLECKAFLNAIATRVPPGERRAKCLRRLRGAYCGAASLMTQGQPVYLQMRRRDLRPFTRLRR